LAGCARLAACSAVFRITAEGNASSAARGIARVALLDALAGNTAAFAVRDVFACVATGAAVGSVFREVEALLAASFEGIRARERAFALLAGSSAVEQRGACRAAAAAVHDIARGLDAGAAAVSRTSGATIGANAARAHLAVGTGYVAKPTVLRVAAQVHARAPASHERRLAGDLALASVTAHGGAKLGSAGFAAASAVEHVRAGVDARRPARDRSLGASEGTRARDANRVAAGRGYAACSTRAAVLGIVVERRAGAGTELLARAALGDVEQVVTAVADAQPARATVVAGNARAFGSAGAAV